MEILNVSYKKPDSHVNFNIGDKVRTSWDMDAEVIALQDSMISKRAVVQVKWHNGETTWFFASDLKHI